MIVAVAKRIGMSFEEINELSIQSLIDIAYEYAGSSEAAEKNNVRKATQADMDRFTGYRTK